MLRSLTAAGVAIAATAASATPVLAQRPPIVVRSCTVLQATDTRRHYWYPWGPVVARDLPIVDGIRIVYMNVGPAAANRVAFAVNYRGDQQRIVDVGTFSPNVTIDHTFGNFSGDAYLGPRPNACTARAVRFVVGTVWRAAGL